MAEGCGFRSHGVSRGKDVTSLMYCRLLISLDYISTPFMKRCHREGFIDQQSTVYMTCHTA